MASERAYDVVISCVGENRSYAEELAAALEVRFITYFYDREDRAKAEIAGELLPNTLTDIYENQSHFCVILFSDIYATKRWPRLELEASLRRAAAEQGYIIAVLLNDAHVVPELSNTSLLSWPPENPGRVADIILFKLKKSHWQRQEVNISKERKWFMWPFGSQNKSSVLRYSWRDIASLDTTVWVCGAIEEGGGSGNVGRGVLLQKNATKAS